MGLFSRIKNSITGSWADVTIEALEPKIGEEFTVIVHVAVKAEDIDIDAIYLKVRSEEIVNLPSYHFSGLDGYDPFHYDIDESVMHYEDSFEVTGAQHLEANQEYSFETKVLLPESSYSTFKGKLSSHEWLFYAGLDMKGNDPDSGWIEVEIN